MGKTIKEGFNMKCTLEVIRGARAGTSIDVTGDLFSIGREKNAGIKSNNLDFDHLLDSKVSRSHAEIVRTKDGFYFKEISGKNNTWINGVISTSALLKDGDIITFGKDGPSIRVHIVFEKNEISPLGIIPNDYNNIKKNSIGRKTLFEIIGLERQKTEEGILGIRKKFYFTLASLSIAFFCIIIFGWKGYTAYSELRETDAIIKSAITDFDLAVSAEIENLKKSGYATDRDIQALRGRYESLKRSLPAMSSEINKTRKSVVRISTIYDIIESGTERKAVYNGQPCRFTSFGSGFSIKEDGYIITNAHIVSPWLFNKELAGKKLTGKRMSVSVTFDGEDRVYTAEVHSFDKESDLAILKVNRISSNYLKFSEIEPSAGDQVAILGFPSILDNVGVYATCMVIGGNISRVDSNGTILYSMVTHSGNSGGPVILPSGEVIALHSSGLCTDKDPFFVFQGAEDMMVMSNSENDQYMRDPAGTVDVSNMVRLSNENVNGSTKNISKGISVKRIREFLEKNIGL